ncbi:lamin-B receptor [Glossina fuscipes]|uniref:Lamin-B receptor n=1 Tax=Glossina fuscipes TaxID=7396 RepID=A0A9C5Z1V3_9MUSC|nr:lamin-B receptor [Glossina fuscipes]XP_037888293.1 lamin-B receptor [Glossina fuscipes]KAI9582861.1 hypothetical protein GQX74_012078 [Glossina fuscipes]
MENQRITRGRTKKADVSNTASTTTKSTPVNVGRRSAVAASGVSTAVNEQGAVLKRYSPAPTRSSSPKRASPGRTRRTSRPPSTVPATTIAEAAITQPLSNVKEEEDFQNSTNHTNLPTTLTTNTASLAPNKIASTSSVHSSYSSTTQQTVEIHTSSAQSSIEINKLADYIRRSVSKTFSTTRGGTETREGSVLTTNESRYSRSVSRSIYEEDGRFSKAEYSDSDGADMEGDYLAEGDDEFKSFNVTNSEYTLCRQVKAPREFGGWFGASVLMLLGPAVFYYLQWCCVNFECSLKIPNIRAPFNIAHLITEIFDGPSVGAYLALHFGVFVLSALLPGRYVRLPGSACYKFTALPMAITILIAFICAQYWKYPAAEFIIQHQKRFGIYGIINAYVVALWAYLRSDMLSQRDLIQFNNYAKSGNFLVDYALGRQLNPKWLNLVEYKQVFYRTSMLSTLLYTVSCLCESVFIPWLPNDKRNWQLISYFAQHLKYDSVMLLCSGMLLIYIFDSIIFEHHLASSFELQGEGFGCLLLLRYAVTPYLLTAVAEYFFVRRTSYTCCFAIWTPLVLLSIGIFLKRFSNAMKYKYRLQPNHPLFTNVDSIHTFQGRRLLTHSVWGFVRQPNYLGDIIALLSLTLPLYLRFAWPPLISVCLLIALLMHRCKRVNARNTARYHSSWVRYCRIVPHYLVPHIF